MGLLFSFEIYRLLFILPIIYPISGSYPLFTFSRYLFSFASYHLTVIYSVSIGIALYLLNIKVYYLPIIYSVSSGIARYLFNIKVYPLPIISSVSSGVHDAEVGQAHELHPVLTQCPAACPDASPGVYSPDPRARVAVLRGSRGCAGLPVPVSVHHDRPQLLLLHVCGPAGLPGKCPVCIHCVYG